jgi:periplasmic divalent cation tolerance protein
MEYKNVVVFVTVGSPEHAQKIANQLLTEKKAACVNIVPQVDSHFWWHGKIENAGEQLLIIKTRSALLADVEKIVKSIHPYTVPEIIALPIIGGNQDFLNWVDKETTS